MHFFSTPPCPGSRIRALGHLASRTLFVRCASALLGLPQGPQRKGTTQLWAGQIAGVIYSADGRTTFCCFCVCGFPRFNILCTPIVLLTIQLHHYTPVADLPASCRRPRAHTPDVYFQAHLSPCLCHSCWHFFFSMLRFLFYVLILSLSLSDFPFLTPTVAVPLLQAFAPR